MKKTMVTLTLAALLAACDAPPGDAQGGPAPTTEVRQEGITRDTGGGGGLTVTQQCELDYRFCYFDCFSEGAGGPGAPGLGFLGCLNGCVSKYISCMDKATRGSF